MNDVEAAHQAAGQRLQFRVEIAELVPGHPAATDEATEPGSQRSEPAREVGIAVGRAVRNGAEAPLVEPVSQLDVARAAAPMRIARIFEPDSRRHVSAAPRRAGRE